jgi:hypothetical protein
MNKTECYQNYPIKFVLGASILQLTIYLCGMYIIYQLGPFWVFPYMIYIVLLEVRLLQSSCVHCYYFGKRCAFGKGKLSSFFFKKGNPATFISKEFHWYDLIPDFLVSIIPLIIGITLLFLHFNWILLILVALLIILSFPVNGYLRSSFACRYCTQRDLGCPAERLFNKKKSVQT